MHRRLVRWLARRASPHWPSAPPGRATSRRTTRPTATTWRGPTAPPTPGAGLLQRREVGPDDAVLRGADHGPRRLRGHAVGCPRPARLGHRRTREELHPGLRLLPAEPRLRCSIGVGTSNSAIDASSGAWLRPTDRPGPTPCAVWPPGPTTTTPARPGVRRLGPEPSWSTFDKAEPGCTATTARPGARPCTPTRRPTGARRQHGRQRPVQQRLEPGPRLAPGLGPRPLAADPADLRHQRRQGPPVAAHRPVGHRATRATACTSTAR